MPAITSWRTRTNASSPGCASSSPSIRWVREGRLRGPLPREPHDGHGLPPCHRHGALAPQHRRPPPASGGSAPRPAGGHSSPRRRSPDVPATQRGMRPLRLGADPPRCRTRHPHIVDGETGRGFLQPDIRPLQARRGAGADRSRHGQGEPLGLHRGGRTRSLHRGPRRARRPRLLPACVPHREAGGHGRATVDPAPFVAAIQRYRVTQSFGSPAIWDRVGRYCVERQLALPSLRRVLMAGAPVSPTVLERVHRILPDSADAHTPYGATEALPVSSITARDVLRDTAAKTRAGKGTCVGKLFPRITLRVIRITDEALPAWDDRLVLPHGQIGELVVKGPVVTREYFRRERDSALAKIKDGDAWWHRMGDVGYLDEQGRVWYCGRKGDRVQTTSGTLFTDPCEAIFNQHQDVCRSGLVGVGSVGHQRPVIVIEPQPGRFPATADEVTRFRDELLQLGAASPVTAASTTVLFHRAFPVDVRHNVKISRDKLVACASRQNPSAGAPIALPTAIGHGEGGVEGDPGRTHG